MKIINSCINEFDESALDEDIALAKILKTIKSIRQSEKVKIENAFGRVIAENITSRMDLPSFNNSAMDGYAVNIKNLIKNNFTLLEHNVSLAGKPYLGKLKEGYTVRVMTGAVVPDNTDAVIMKEMVSIDGNYISFKKHIKKNQNIRFVGEDIKKNQRVFSKNEVLDYSKIAILASLGISEVRVLRKPIISFFSTGDELVSINKKIKKGQIYDSNRYLLKGLLKGLPVVIKDAGVIADDERKIINKLNLLSKSADLIITTGGVSVGDADFVKNALAKVGKINFWKISIKPGRPLAFGKIGSSYFFGLPGNPVSAAVTFDLFVKPAILKIYSVQQKSNLVIKAKLKGDLKKKKGRVEYKRGVLYKKDNIYFVKASGLQGSNILSSLASANSYIRLNKNTQNLSDGEIVDVIPFEIKI